MLLFYLSTYINNQLHLPVLVVLVILILCVILMVILFYIGIRALNVMNTIGHTRKEPKRKNKKGLCEDTKAAKHVDIPEI